MSKLQEAIDNVVKACEALVEQANHNVNLFESCCDKTPKGATELLTKSEKIRDDAKELQL